MNIRTTDEFTDFGKGKQAPANVLGACFPETAAQGHRTLQTEDGVTVTLGKPPAPTVGSICFDPVKDHVADRAQREMWQGQQARTLDPKEIERQLGLIQPAEKSGAMREKLDAIPYDLVPFQEMTEAYARVAEFGAKKYAAWNWSLGLKRVQILGSLLRHAFAYLRGEERDRESGLLHTDHILWNAAALSHNAHWNLEDGRRAEPPRAYKSEA